MEGRDPGRLEEAGGGRPMRPIQRTLSSFEATCPRCGERGRFSLDPVYRRWMHGDHTAAEILEDSLGAASQRGNCAPGALRRRIYAGSPHYEQKIVSAPAADHDVFGAWRATGVLGLFRKRGSATRPCLSGIGHPATFSRALLASNTVFWGIRKNRQPVTRRRVERLTRKAGELAWVATVNRSTPGLVPSPEVVASRS